MTEPTTPTGKALWPRLHDEHVGNRDLRPAILAIEQEATDMAVAKLAMVGPVVTDKATLDRGLALVEAKIREQERERLRDAIDRLPSVVFLPHDIERIYAGETLPLVTRRALWNLLNPEID